MPPFFLGHPVYINKWLCLPAQIAAKIIKTNYDRSFTIYPTWATYWNALFPGSDHNIWQSTIKILWVTKLPLHFEEVKIKMTRSYIIEISVPFFSIYNAHYIWNSFLHFGPNIFKWSTVTTVQILITNNPLWTIRLFHRALMLFWLRIQNKTSRAKMKLTLRVRFILALLVLFFILNQNSILATVK